MTVSYTTVYELHSQYLQAMSAPLFIIATRVQPQNGLVEKPLMIPYFDGFLMVYGFD